MAYPTNSMLENTPLGMYFQGQSIGDEQRLNREKSEAHALKYLMDQMTAGNDLAKSDLEGAQARVLNTPDLLARFAANEGGKWDSNAVKGRTDVALEESDIAQKKSKNLLDRHSNENKIVYEQEVGRALAGLPPDGAGSNQIGFQFQPSATSAPQTWGGEVARTGRPSLATVRTTLESGKIGDFRKDGTPLTSPKGAMYSTQTMPSTAADPGFGIRPAADKSPAEFNRVGNEYLAVMEKRYGDPIKALAAYNAGPGVVDKLIQQYGDRWAQYLPAETKEYIRKGAEMLGGQNVPIEQVTTQPKTRLDMVREILGNTPSHWASMDLERLKGEKARSTALATGDAADKRLFGQEKIKAMGEMRQYDVAISTIDKEIAKMRSKEYLQAEITNIIAQEQIPESQAMQVAQARVQAQIAEYESNKEQFRSMRDYYAEIYQLPKSISTPTKPQGTGAGLQQQVEKAGVQYEPNKYEYRIGPNGEVQRKAKG